MTLPLSEDNKMHIPWKALIPAVIAGALAAGGCGSSEKTTA
jgi:hypothetical protein